MSFSDAISTILKIKRLMVVAVAILGGAGYKFGPMVYHKFEARTVAQAETKPVMGGIVGTNAEGIKISACDLGTISLTNHYETCVSFGAGKNCTLTPNLIDKNNVQITLAVESKNNQGKIQDLSITQVTTRSGQALEVAVGRFDFSMTPNVTSE